MKSIAENDLGADVTQLQRRHAFHGAVGADRHERWRFNDAVRGVKTPTACVALPREKLKLHEWFSARRCINIASP